MWDLWWLSWSPNLPWLGKKDDLIPAQAFGTGKNEDRSSMWSHKWAEQSAGAAGKCCVCCRSCDLAVCGRRTQTEFKNKPKLRSLGRGWWRPLTGARDHPARQWVAGSDSVLYRPTRPRVLLQMHMDESGSPVQSPECSHHGTMKRNHGRSFKVPSLHGHYMLHYYSNKMELSMYWSDKNTSLTENSGKYAASSDARAKKCRRKSFYSPRAGG